MNDTVIAVIILLIMFIIACSLGFYHYNWELHAFSSNDVSQILTCITIILTILGAAFAYYKWIRDKDKEKAEKLLTNITAKFISCIIKQEVYRKIANKEGGKLYSKENLPIITSRVGDTGRYSVLLSVDKRRITEILSNEDFSYANFELVCLINQYILLDTLERLYKDPEFAREKFKQDNIHLLTDAEIINEFWDIYLEPDKEEFGHIRVTPYGQEYALIVKHQKDVECKLINAMIEEYNRELTALDIKHDLITWENILEKSIVNPEEIANLTEDARNRANKLQGKILSSYQNMPINKTVEAIINYLRSCGLHLPH